MDNTNIVLAANIQKYRKKCGLTQEELAQKIGVTFQAISKWENAKSAPDISFLPVMADLFDCSIDELFSRNVQSTDNIKYCTEFPWADDDIIRGVVCEGRKILKVTDKITEKFTFEIIGDAKSVESKCNIEVSGNVFGGCNAGDSIKVGGNLWGGVNCGNSVQCSCNIHGGINCGDNVTAACDILGDINCGENASAGCDIKAGTVKCNKIQCETLECDIIDNNVSIK